MLLDQLGIFICQLISVMFDGNWLLLVFYCCIEFGEKWVGNNDVSVVKIFLDCGKSWCDVVVLESLGCVYMSIILFLDGRLVVFFCSCWVDYIWFSQFSDQGESWFVLVLMMFLNNNLFIQVIFLDNGELVLVFNNMSVVGVMECCVLLYDEIVDDDGCRELEVIGKSVFWGVLCVLMIVVILVDGGESWLWLCNFDEGDGYCMINNLEQKLNWEFFYFSIKQGVDGNLYIVYIWYCQVIKYVCVLLQWVKGESV